MPYLLYRALQKIRAHKWVYVLIEMQIIVGVVILMVCSHSFLSAWQKMNDYLELAQTEAVEISIYGKSSQDSTTETTAPFSSQDYKYALSLYPQANSVTCIAAATCPIGSDKMVYLVGIAPHLFNSLFDIEMTGSCAYLSSELRNELGSGTYENGEHDIILDTVPKSSSLRISTTQYSLCDLPSSAPKEISLSLNEGLNLDVCQCVFIDMSLFPDDLYANFVLLRLPDDEESIRFLEYLQQQHGLYYTYTMRHLQADVQKSMEDLSNNTDLLFIVSIILFIVVATGLIGILLIFTNSRKKDMAIAQVYGASGKQIRTEFFIEIAFLYIVGCFIGICVSGVLVPSFSTALFVVRFQPLSIIIGITLALLCTVTVYTITVSEIRNATIHTILVGDR